MISQKSGLRNRILWLIANPEDLTKLLNAICTHDHEGLGGIDELHNLLIGLLQDLHAHFNQEKENSRLFVESIITLTGLKGRFDSLEIISEKLGLLISGAIEGLIANKSTPLNKLTSFSRIFCRGNA